MQEEASMGQRAPIRANDGQGAADGLVWAEIAGLVEIHSNGSWNLTPQGVAGMLDLLGRAHPFDARPARRDRKQQRYLV
jgi:hypothetical protein